MPEASTSHGLYRHTIQYIPFSFRPVDVEFSATSTAECCLRRPCHPSEAPASHRARVGGGGWGPGFLVPVPRGVMLLPRPLTALRQGCCSGGQWPQGVGTGSCQAPGWLLFLCLSGKCFLSSVGLLRSGRTAFVFASSFFPRRPASAWVRDVGVRAPRAAGVSAPCWLFPASWLT